MFGNLKTNQEAMSEKSDRIGGGYKPLESGIYRAEVVYAYGTQSKNGASGVIVKFNILQEDKEPYPFTQTFWVSDKKGNTFYLDKDGKPHNLAGFNQANHLCELLTGAPLSEVEIEEITLSIYDFEQKKEVPTTVQALTALHDKELALAIKHIRENKREKSTSTGEYEPVNEERFLNEIDKVFAIKNGVCFTYDEVKAEIEPEFAEKWLQRWEGKLDDKYKEVKGAGSAKAGTTRKLGIG